MQSWTFYLGCLKSLVECICVCFWVNVFCLWWPTVSSIHVINICCWVMFLLYKMNKKAIDGSTAGHNFLLLGTNTHPFNGPFSGLPRWAGTRKVKPIWILLKQETVSGSGISWAICKSASCSRQTTTLVFLQAGCLSCHPTNSINALKAIFGY